MIHDLRRLSLAAILGAGALALGACGSSSHSSSSTATGSTSSAVAASAPVAVVGKSTTVTLNPATVQLLSQNGITITAVAPAKATKVLVFPVTGGHISVTTFAGSIEQSGGITLAHGGRSVQLTNFVLNTESKQITAVVGGMRVPIFDLNLAAIRRASGPNGTLLASDIKLVVTEEAASSLDGLLGVTGLKAGQDFGVATITLAIK
ncbi:MAG TPA: hypothetical protein VKG82_06815 [Solirubrobacteraceae bacterium]|nr:hypothetical protein [Solirubrobacteraceae bacterium]